MEDKMEELVAKGRCLECEGMYCLDCINVRECPELHGESCPSGWIFERSTCGDCEGYSEGWCVYLQTPTKKKDTMCTDGVLK